MMRGDLSGPGAGAHIWQASLEDAGSLQGLFATLTDDERIRWGRFQSERARDHFVVARGVLRAILARYTGCHPADLRFCYGADGKPGLARVSSRYDLRFSVTHSRDLALYAITQGREVGVDLEYSVQPPDEGIAERFFSSREAAALRALPSSERQEAFYACWTRKEAYLKARGDGLRLDLRGFDVSVAPAEPAALLRPACEEDEGRWSLAALEVSAVYAAALCVEGRLPSLTYRHWG